MRFSYPPRPSAPTMLSMLAHVTGTPPTPTQIALVVIFAFVCTVIALNLVALASGWRKLANRFRHDAPFTGTIWRWQSAKFRWGSNYNNCLTVGASQEGLYLAMPSLFSFGHAPLLIPWAEITKRAQNTLFGPVFVLTLGLEERIPVTLRSNLALKIEEAKSQNFPVS